MSLNIPFVPMDPMGKRNNIIWSICDSGGTHDSRWYSVWISFSQLLQFFHQSFRNFKVQNRERTWWPWTSLPPWGGDVGGFFWAKMALEMWEIDDKKTEGILEIDETFFFADYDQIDTKRCNQVGHLLNFVSRLFVETSSVTKWVFISLFCDFVTFFSAVD